ncbi:MAG: DegV family protein [Oscillospiraceae bacterium]
MEKIKIMSDTACDIPKEIGAALGIDLLPIPITIDGKGYLEGEDFTYEEFYEILLQSKELPFTSHITAPAFTEKFIRAYKEGYNRIICTTINSKGSSMFEAAIIAKELFYGEYPEAKDKVKIAVLDSKTYSMAYGLPLMIAADKLKNGANYDELVEYLIDAYNRVEVYFTVFTLDFAKRSGRISAAAALVGGMLGLRPIMTFMNGDNKVVSKVRGDKQAVAELANIAAERYIVPKSPYVVLVGDDKQAGEPLVEAMTKQMGYPPIGVYFIGSCVAINAGPKVVGQVFLGESRL